MWPWSGQADRPADNAGTAQERREGERFETAVLQCSIGAIVEVSRAGMSVRVERLVGFQPGTTLAVELSAPADSMDVQARVVAAEPLGGGRYRIGLEFVGMSDADRQAIENLALHGRKRPPGAFASPGARLRLVEALSMPDHYAALGLRFRASDEDIQRAYRGLARKYHPDVCREEGSQALFCRINSAHATLSDPAQRSAYDELYALRRAA